MKTPIFLVAFAFAISLHSEANDSTPSPNPDASKVKSTFDHFRDYLTESQCQRDERRFMGCMRFIETLSCMIEPQSKFYISYEKEGPEQVSKDDTLIEAFGNWVWAKSKKSNYNCRQNHFVTGRKNFDLFIDHYRIVNGNLSALDLPISKIVDSLESRVQSQPTKLPLAITAYEEFLNWAWDGHAKIISKSPAGKLFANFPDSSPQAFIYTSPTGKHFGQIKFKPFMNEYQCLDVIFAVRALTELKVAGLVLDLRNNPGGLLATGICISNLFLGPKVVVATLDVSKGRYGNQVKGLHSLNIKMAITQLPIVVLVNENTASTGEVMAAALQSHGRAWIAGQQTFGKGTKQAVLPFDDDHVNLSTDGLLYSPNLWSHQGYGVPVDFVLPENRDGKIKNETVPEREMVPFPLEAPQIANDSQHTAITQGTDSSGQRIPPGWTQQRPELKKKIEECLKNNQIQGRDHRIVTALAILECESKVTHPAVTSQPASP